MRIKRSRKRNRRKMRERRKKREKTRRVQRVDPKIKTIKSCRIACTLEEMTDRMFVGAALWTDSCSRLVYDSLVGSEAAAKTRPKL